MSQTPNRPPNRVKLSEDEIRSRAQSLRATPARRSDATGVAGKVTETVTGVTHSIFTGLLSLLRLPLTIVGGVLAVIFFNGQEWTNFIGALGLGFIVMVVIFFGLTRLVAYLDYKSYRKRVSR